MKNWALVCVLLVAYAGCGGEKTKPSGQAPTAPEVTSPSGAQTVMEARTNLFLYDTESTGGGEQKPRFAVKDAVVSMDENNAWSFTNAQAVIYGKDGTETQLNAGEGFLDQKGQKAYLKGGVTMKSGTMEIKLEDIEWRNEERRAFSDKPITLRDQGSELTASSLQYDPDAKKLTLTNISGTIQYERSETP